MLITPVDDKFPVAPVHTVTIPIMLHEFCCGLFKVKALVSAVTILQTFLSKPVFSHEFIERRVIQDKIVNLSAQLNLKF